MYPRRFSSTTNYLTNQLPFDEFRSVIDAIIPVAIRSAQKEPFGNGLWNGGGGGRWANFVYERVTISYVASFRVNPVLGMGEPMKLDDSEVAKQKEKPKPIKDDFPFTATQPRKLLPSSGTNASKGRCNGSTSCRFNNSPSALVLLS